MWPVQEHRGREGRGTSGEAGAVEVAFEGGEELGRREAEGGCGVRGGAVRTGKERRVRRRGVDRERPARGRGVLVEGRVDRLDLESVQPIQQRAGGERG